MLLKKPKMLKKEMQLRPNQRNVNTINHDGQIVNHPDKSLSKNSLAMFQRWSVALGAYKYTIEHRSAKHIQRADFL